MMREKNSKLVRGLLGFQVRRIVAINLDIKYSLSTISVFIVTVIQNQYVVAKDSLTGDYRELQKLYSDIMPNYSQ